MIKKPHGELSVYEIHNGEKKLLFRQHNQIQNDYAQILSRMLAGENLKIDTLYLEFENVANQGDTTTAPTFDASEGAEYYANLTDNCDFVRHPLVLTPEVDEDSVTFSAVVASGTGHNGLAFGTPDVNSRIYSAALVASQSETDQTKDLIFARTNWETQKVKSTEQLGVYWKIYFEVTR